MPRGVRRLRAPPEDRSRRVPSRQAESFAASSTLSAPDVTERAVVALGDVSRQRVLDVACGPGILSNAISSPGPAPSSESISTAETLRLAKTRSPDTAPAAFVRGVAEILPFRDGAFGAAVIRLALHHFEQPHRILEEVHRVLVPGGRLVVLDILTSRDSEVSGLHNAIERLRDPSHTTFLSDSQLRDAIANAKFGAIEIDTWQKSRSFSDWAAIINEPTRMAALETLLRHLARGGESAGIQLREENGEVWFTYGWALLVATAA